MVHGRQFLTFATVPVYTSRMAKINLEQLEAPTQEELDAATPKRETEPFAVAQFDAAMAKKKKTNKTNETAQGQAQSPPMRSSELLRGSAPADGTEDEPVLSESAERRRVQGRNVVTVAVTASPMKLVNPHIGLVLDEDVEDFELDENLEGYSAQTQQGNVALPVGEHRGPPQHARRDNDADSFPSSEADDSDAEVFL